MGSNSKMKFNENNEWKFNDYHRLELFGPEPDGAVIDVIDDKIYVQHQVRSEYGGDTYTETVTIPITVMKEFMTRLEQQITKESE